MIVSCEIIFSVNGCSKTVEMKMFVVNGTISESEYFQYRQYWWISLNKSGNRTNEKTFWLQPSVVYIEPFTPRSWRTTTQTRAQLEVQTMEIVVKFFLHLVAIERILVVFLRIQRKSTKEDVVYRSLAKTSNKWLSRIHSML